MPTNLKTFLLLLLVVVCTLGCKKKEPELTDCKISPELSDSPRQLSILFIGTSHTHFNDMLLMVQAIGRSLGDSVYTEMTAPGGYDFHRHFKLPATISALQSRSWDYIVLQESGWRSALPPVMADTMVYNYADSLKRIIHQTNAQAQLVLFMTNGYVGGVKAFDQAWCQREPQVCTYEGMQDRIKDTYLKLGKQLNAQIAPGGMLWKILMKNRSSIDLFNPDGIHPTPLGSYANAIAIYSVIRRKPYKGSYTPSGISQADALLIQNPIADALFECRPNWKNF